MVGRVFDEGLAGIDHRFCLLTETGGELLSITIEFVQLVGKLAGHNLIVHRQKLGRVISM